MNRYLLVSGGCERPNGYELGEGKYYNRAKLLKLDLSSGNVTTVFEKENGGKHYPDEYPNLQFTSCTLHRETLWLPTDTEIFKISYPELEVNQTISYPFFQNIHAVNIIRDRAYVCSTGLDLVAVLNLDGEVVRLVNTEGKDPWHRFSPSADYRVIHSTRPHDCHPNFCFEVDGQPWVTRCRQQDAVCLDDFDQKIEITDPKKRISIHDGVLNQAKIYFTSVDGCLIEVDPLSKKVTEEINVLDALGNEKLGWARGLCFDSKGMAYLAFSRLRRTRMKEKLAWLAKGQIAKMQGMPACVLAYDVEKREVMKKYEIHFDMIDAIFGLQLVDE